MNLIFTLPKHKSETIGFSLSESGTIQGWWNYKSGEEGGYLLVDLSSNCLIDYDGAWDLPKYIVRELEGLRIKVENFE